ncbi:MAG TPA: SDR family oxidoreductase [Solirubrobacteraceae bacterium]|jgi:nucleoside-diphosphate-sugar epimerase|nr:SDR family oxidoreductase [Solirubrobacteraceae bacterium]
MRVFVTGASGHIGSAVVPELLSSGHEVVGLARSDASAAMIEAAGAAVQRGDLDDLDVLRAAAADADGVIHLAFKHEAMRTGNFASAITADFSAIQAIANGLDGSGKPFVSTSGTLMLARGGISGRPGTEADAIPEGPRVDAENFVIGLSERGVRSSIVRLPPLVHSDLDRHGFGPTLIAIARGKGYAGYPEDGANRWPAGHTLDAAAVYRLALESAPAGSRFHAVGDEGIPFRDIAEAIGRNLDLPARSVSTDKTEGYFAFLSPFVGLDNPTSSAITRTVLDWKPVHRGLIDDLDAGHYFQQ